jgi:hypothetical protein
MRSRPSRRWAAAPALPCAALVAAVVTLAACSQPAADAPDRVLPSTVEVAIQPTILPIDPAATDFDDDATEPAPTDDGHDHPFDASDRLTGGKCAHSGDSWSFAGTMTNPSSDEVTYTVGVTLLSTKDMSDVVTKEITVTVPGGGTAPVEAKDFHKGPATDLTCLTGVTIKEDH